MREPFFTADPHFGHTNVIGYSKRPFKSIEEHDETLIANWNSVISSRDDIYLLGDVGMGSRDHLIEVFNRLNGRIYLISGNHDKRIVRGKLRDRFEWIKDYYELAIRDEEMEMRHRITLCHYPFEVWNKRHFGSWSLHGHCHGMLPSPDWQARLDVGVDVHNYTPISYQQVKNAMTGKVFKKIDSHGKKKKWLRTIKKWFTISKK